MKTQRITNRQVSRLFVGLSLLICLTSCENTTEAPEPLVGREFYPLEEGRFIVYYVSEICYAELAGNDTSSYLIKEKTAGVEEVSAEGDTIWRIERYRYDLPPDASIDLPESEDEWQIDSVWALRSEPSRIVRVESNVPLVKLVFPAEDGKTWDGHALSSRPSETWRMSIDNPILEGGLGLIQVYPISNGRFLDVVQEDFVSLVNRNVRREEYIGNFGLYYREYTKISYVSDSEDPRFGQDFPIDGIMHVETFLEDGIE